MTSRTLGLLLACLAAAPCVAAEPATVPALLEVARVASDANGKSHFAVGAVPLDVQDYAPPGPPIAVSPRLPASDIAFAALPPGYVADWHVAPRRQYGMVLAGAIEIETGDGARQTFARGSVFLLEDVAGQGHRTRVSGDEVAMLGLVPVAPGAPQVAGNGAPAPRR